MFINFVFTVANSVQSVDENPKFDHPNGILRAVLTSGAVYCVYKVTL